MPYLNRPQVLGFFKLIAMRPAKLRNLTFYIFILYLISSFSCNLSDDTKTLPGGNNYVHEGRCYKYILVNLKDGSNIESCVSEYKYDDNYITVAQIEELKCEKSIQINEEDKKFFIIDNKNEKLLGPFSHANFKVEFDNLQINKDLFVK